MAEARTDPLPLGSRRGAQARSFMEAGEPPSKKGRT